MTNKQQQIPAIRFNGFTDTWEQRKVFDMSEITFGGGTPKTGNEDYWQGNFPWIQSSDLKNDQLCNVIPTKFITDEAINKSATKAVPANSIAVVTRVGVGKLALMPYPYATSQDFLSLSNLKVDPWFGVYSLYVLIQKEINNIQGTSIKGMTKSDLLSKNIHIPFALDEQTKIGNFFKQLDDTIALHQRQMDNCKELKKTSMQKIFNQELRFKDKNGNDYPVWQKKKLKDLGKFYSGTGFNDKYQGYLDLSIPFFKVSDMNIASNSKYMVESNNTVDDDICREMKINKITGPAILFAKVGAAIYMERKRIVHNDFLMDNNMMALRINDSVDIEFTYYLCQSLSFSKYAQVGALPSYNASDIGRLHCKLPVISEQKKIAIFLSTLDQKVNEAAQKVELFKELKEGLMQQMFF